LCYFAIKDYNFLERCVNSALITLHLEVNDSHFHVLFQKVVIFWVMEFDAYGFTTFE